MLERQLEYEKVRLEAESRKACLESQEKVNGNDIHDRTLIDTKLGPARGFFFGGLGLSITKSNFWEN